MKICVKLLHIAIMSELSGSPMHLHTGKRMLSLLQHSTALISGSVQDNVAIPVTAMMITVCISTDA